MNIKGVDRILCINLDRRLDRWASFSRAVDEAGFPDIERVSGIDGPGFPLFKALPAEFAGFEGSLGCTWSHWMVAKMVLKNGWASALVFEDDARPTVGFNEIRDFIEWALPLNPLQVHLGNVGILSYSPEVLDHGLRLKAAVNLHGYVITRTLARLLDEAMTRNPFRSDLGVHADRRFPELIAAAGSFVIAPLEPLCAQDKESPSDVRWGCPDHPDYFA